MTPLVRIGAIGDIHAEDQTLERVLDHLAGLSLDRILAVGDIVDGPRDSARCCRLLAQFGVDAVRVEFFDLAAGRIAPAAVHPLADSR